ncbi:MAG TPA: aminotransferase class V-fold PLP-dependent enzyme [Pricia sp.]|nr:aminotransferase class V-fold PLP-dependent enzyme [Pricia sp.]
MENIRKHFPVLSQYLYADTASAGLLSDTLMTWRQEHDLDYLIGGSTMKTKAMGNGIPEIRKTVARFFGATPESTALVPNFSLGLNLLLEGFDTSRRVLLVQGDYPSVNWPFEHRDYKISYVSLDENLEDNIRDTIKAGNISVLAFSLVQWVNGIQIDLDFLSGLKADFPELIIIADGTQFCGTTDFNFLDSAIDVLGASGYKWLLGGYGNGFFLFKEGLETHFAVKTTGFNAADANLDMEDDIRFAKHLEPGHLDTLNFGSLKFSLEYLESLGKGNIETHLAKLSKKGQEEFAELGLLEDAVVARKAHSTIFKINGDKRLYRKLEQHDVVCSQRGGGIRLSFHCYNTETDVDQIVKILKTAL